MHSSVLSPVAPGWIQFTPSGRNYIVRAQPWLMAAHRPPPALKTPDSQLFPVQHRHNHAAKRPKERILNASMYPLPFKTAIEKTKRDYRNQQERCGQERSPLRVNAEQERYGGHELDGKGEFHPETRRPEADSLEKTQNRRRIPGDLEIHVGK
jgi:hypothetical protein